MAGARRAVADAAVIGYDVHIHRGQDWSDLADEERIALETWQDYVERDPEFRLDGFAEAETSSGDVLRVEGPGLAVWTAHPSPPDGGQAWFDWWDGMIVVKNPDDAMLVKMREIAQALGARVQGDDGEFYDGEQVAPAEAPPEKPGGLLGRLFGRR